MVFDVMMRLFDLAVSNLIEKELVMITSDFNNPILFNNMKVFTTRGL